MTQTEFNHYHEEFTELVSSEALWVDSETDPLLSFCICKRCWREVGETLSYRLLPSSTLSQFKTHLKEVHNILSTGK